MPHDLERDGVDLLLRFPMQAELRRDAQLLRRYVAGAPSVEDDAGELGELFKRCVHFFSSGFLLGVNSSGPVMSIESSGFLSRPESSCFGAAAGFGAAGAG